MLLDLPTLERFAALTREQQIVFFESLSPRDQRHLHRAVDEITGSEVDDEDLNIPLEPYQRIDTDDWSIRLFSAGRGAGKTYTGAAWAVQQAELHKPGLPGLLIAPTFQAVREVMVEGQGSGLLALLGDRLVNYNRSTYEITTRSGSKLYMRSADRPDSIRGLNLAWAWADEVAAWTRPEAWHEGMMPALRIGERPQVMVTTTPRRVRLIRDLYDRFRDGDESVVLQTATMFDNPHLSQIAKDELLNIYGGTQLGEQELYGKLIELVIGAIWRQEWIQRTSHADIHERGGMSQLSIGVDPSGSAEGTGDECGIIVAGRDVQGNGYVIDDRTIRGSPGEWVAQIIDAYHSVYGRDQLNADGWRAQFVAIEADGNMGGLAKELIARLDQHIPVNLVYTRGKSKEDRARPISMLWEKGQIYHLGIFDQLEDEMTGWVPAESKYSPDRLDALVWAMTALFPASGFAGMDIPTTDRRLAHRGR